MIYVRIFVAYILWGEISGIGDAVCSERIGIAKIFSSVAGMTYVVLPGMSENAGPSTALPTLGVSCLVNITFFVWVCNGILLWFEFAFS